MASDLSDQSWRSGFNITLMFEPRILSLGLQTGPSILVPMRLYTLYESSVKTSPNYMRFFKLVSFRGMRSCSLQLLHIVYQLTSFVDCNDNLCSYSIGTLNPMVDRRGPLESCCSSLGRVSFRRGFSNLFFVLHRAQSLSSAIDLAQCILIFFHNSRYRPNEELISS